MQPFLQPPSMMKTQSGTFVPMAGPHQVIGVVKKFLLVFQYHEGDREDCQELAALICDMERIKNKDVDVLIFSRSDAGPFAPDITAKLKLKFNEVIIQKSIRKDAKGHPFGCNGMFYDLVTMLGQQARWLNSYYAFMNLEPDCVPLCAGWLPKLIEEFKGAVDEGLAMIGHKQINNPITHMNGVGIYAIDIWRRVPGGALGGGSPDVPFDIRQANRILPLAKDTPLMFFKYRQPTITPEELFSPHKGVPAVFYHGVKDGSAREAVRQKCINLSANRDFSRKTVFTFSNPEPIGNADEEKATLAIWRQGWVSRGWNPVILHTQEVMKNGRYGALKAAIEKFPWIGDKHKWDNAWLRYLALDTMGGGLYADTEVIPGDFTPVDTDGIVGFELLSENTPSLFYADKPSVARWLDTIINYAVSDDDKMDSKPYVNDWTIMQRQIEDGAIKQQKFCETFGAKDYDTFKAVVFTDFAVSRNAKGKRKSFVMENFLKNT